MISPERRESALEASRRALFALAVGAAGGAVFAYLGLPLAWMLGAMCLSTAGALMGKPLYVPPALRTVMVAVLGLMLGAVFTPELLARAGQWLGALALLVAYLAIAGLVVLVYLRRLAGYDAVTAYFAAMPGGFNEMIITGEAMGGDVRAISLTHTVRVFAVVLAVPFYFRVVVGLEAPAAALQVTASGPLGIADGLILGLCGMAGFFLARAIRLPAAALVGPMAASAAVHLGGFSEAAPPAVLMALAQVVVGTAIGARFAGISLRQVKRELAVAVGATALLLALAVAFSTASAAALGVTPAALFLALAPGGLAEMSLVALALGVDTAFVSTMHVLRIVLVVIIAPLAFRLRRRRL